MVSPKITQEKDLGLCQILALTCPVLALQMFWSTVFSQISPYLQDIGLTKAVIAGVLVSPPLAGAILAPVLGYISDRANDSSWGRRTPMIVGGALAASDLLIVAVWSPRWTQLMLCWLVDWCDVEAVGNRGLVQTIAVMNIVGLAVAVQPLQIGLRSLIIDQTPAHQHGRVTAWATTLSGTGGVLAFLMGSLDVQHLQLFRNVSSFQVLASLTALMLATTVAIVVVFAGEKDALLCAQILVKENRHFHDVVNHLCGSFERLSPRTRLIYRAQAWAWTAWFPLLYYTTTFISELALRTPASKSPNDLTQVDRDASAIRLGSAASFASAIIVVLSSALIPSAVGYFQKHRLNCKSHVYDPVTLLRLWSLSQAFLAFLMAASILVMTPTQGMILIGLTGIPLAIGQWIPYAIISLEAQHSRQTFSCRGNSGLGVGATLGLYNSSISAPQAVASVLSALVYRMAHILGSEVATAWVIAFSGCAALRSCFLIYKYSQQQ